MSIISKEKLNDGNSWISLYRDDEVEIRVLKNFEPLSPSITRYIFHWIWAKPRIFSMTPGIQYDARLEITDIALSHNLFKTFDAKIFDNNGDKLEFFDVIPSRDWDTVTPGSIMEIIVEELINLRKKPDTIATKRSMLSLSDLIESWMFRIQYVLGNLKEYIFRSVKCPYCHKRIYKVSYTCIYCKMDVSEKWTAYKQMEDRKRASGL